MPLGMHLCTSPPTRLHACPGHRYDLKAMTSDMLAQLREQQAARAAAAAAAAAAGPAVVPKPNGRAPVVAASSKNFIGGPEAVPAVANSQ